MKHYRLMTVFVIVAVSLLLGGCSDRRAGIHPKAEAGVIDLTQAELETGAVRLDGQWEFYWNRLLGPGETAAGLQTGYADVPSSWNRHPANDSAVSGDGYATYRLTFIAREEARLALKIPRLRTAYSLWVNGERIAAAGTVGTTRDGMTPQYLPQIASFDAQPGENEIIIQVSNFHQRSGGILESLRMGHEKLIHRLQLTAIAGELVVFGILVSLGVYHLALFFFRKRNRSPLYFGLFCILIAIRTLHVGECIFIFLFPGFSWEIAHKIQTLTYYLGVPLVLGFSISIFPKYFNGKIVNAVQIAGAAFGTLVLLTPARIFTVVNPVYQVWSVAASLYMLAGLVKIVVNREKESWLIVVGACALLFSGLNDVIFFSIWRNDNGPDSLVTLFRTGSLSSIGQVVFALANSLMLAKRFSYALEQEKIMTAKLVDINAHLDELVLLRTKDLAQSTQKIEHQNLELEKVNRILQKLSFKDPLTGLWNRRKYDQTIQLEWRRCLRFQRPIGLLLLDVDYFKSYNDYYGHTAGDDCLVKVGETLQRSLSRSTDLVARYGGEEFVALLIEAEKKELINVAGILKQSIEALNIPHAKSPVSDHVTVSIGGASMIPDADSSYEDLFRAADKALYQAKDAGRNQVRLLSDQPV